MRKQLLTVVLGAATAITGALAAPAGADPAPPKVVQLGDSYSAGNGARGPSGNADYDQAVPGCYRSPHNYGGQFAASIGATYVNAACSGATTSDILSPDTDENQPPQADAVDASADIVLMTMGGNDVGFTNIVVQCFVLRIGDLCKTALQNAINGVPQMKEQLIAGMTGVRDRMRPDAQFMLVGYPNLTRAASYQLLTFNGWYDVKADLATLMSQGAQAQQEAVDAVNAATGTDSTYYVDTVDEAYAGHEIDQNCLLPRTGDWLWNTAETFVIPETYHPKPAGWTATANEVAAEYAQHPLEPKSSTP